jgi:ABC-2 type transport system ATP-binding protein
MLTLQNVTKRYGSTLALNDVSLSLKPGEFFGLLGPNGAGKTTLMSLIAGLRPPDSGVITLNGEPLRHDRVEQRTQLGFVPQSLALYDELSAEQNLRLFGRLYGLRGAVLRERVEEGLLAAQLQDRRRDTVDTYSGGMRRRLNIVAAILHRPALLLCDEPTVGVDPQSRNAIFEFVQKLNAAGMTIVYSTHYMEEATRLCSRIGIIDHGQLLALGTLDELLLKLPFSEQIRITRNEETAAHLEALRAVRRHLRRRGFIHPHAAAGVAPVRALRRSRETWALLPAFQRHAPRLGGRVSATYRQDVARRLDHHFTTMRTILILVGNEIRRFLTDRAALSLTFLVPVVLIYIFGHVFGLARGGVAPTGISLAVVSEANSPATGRNHSGLAEGTAFKGSRREGRLPAPGGAAHGSTVPALMMAAGFAALSR